MSRPKQIHHALYRQMERFDLFGVQPDLAVSGGA